jgi:hypothetical protein
MSPGSRLDRESAAGVYCTAPVHVGFRIGPGSRILEKNLDEESRQGERVLQKYGSRVSARKHKVNHRTARRNSISQHWKFVLSALGSTAPDPIVKLRGLLQPRAGMKVQQAALLLLAFLVGTGIVHCDSSINLQGKA